MTSPFYLLYLDDYHAEDPMFLQGLGRALARASSSGMPCILLHGSGEAAERLLEGEGFFVERQEGLLQVETQEQAALVERGLRQANRKLVGLLTDAVVSAVGLMGTDRRLLTLQDEGTLAVEGIGWVRSLARQRVVPVIGTLARDAQNGQAREARPDDALIALARALEQDEVTVVFFTQTNLPGLMEGRAPKPSVSVNALPEKDIVPDPEAVRRVVAAGLPVLLTNTTRLVQKEGAKGTFITK